MRMLKAAAAVVGGLLVLLIFYGVGIEPRLLLDIEEEDAPIPGLPAAWQGQRIAMLADFQVGMWWANTGMARRAVEAALRQRPAALLLAGDFIYHPDADPLELVEEVAEILEPIRGSGVPAFAVLGNHDWALDVEDGTRNPQAAQRVRQALAALGITLLHNQAVPLTGAAGEPPLYLVGLGSHYAGDDRPAEALARVPAGAARVVFMHNPSSFPAIAAGAAPLAVAGHTHGGQIRIPFTESWSWIEIVRAGEVHADGWIDGYGAAGNRLYVNRGIGFSDLPIRINCRPELTLFTLRATPETARAQGSPAAARGT